MMSNFFLLFAVACSTVPPARLNVIAPTDAYQARESRRAESWWEPPILEWSDWTISGCHHGKPLPERARTGGTFAVVELTPDALRWRGDPLLQLDGGRFAESDIQGRLLPTLHEQVRESVNTRLNMAEELPCLSITPEAVLYNRSLRVPLETERAVLFTLAQAMADVDWLAAAADRSPQARSWTLDEAVPLTDSPYPSIGPNLVPVASPAGLDLLRGLGVPGQ